MFFNAFAHLSAFPNSNSLICLHPSHAFFPLSSLVYSNTLPHISFPVSIFLWISLSAPVRFSPHTFLVTFCFFSLVSQYIRQHSLSLTFLDVSINPSQSVGVEDEHYFSYLGEFICHRPGARKISHIIVWRQIQLEGMMLL